MEVDAQASKFSQLDIQEVLVRLDKGQGEKLASLIGSLKINKDNASLISKLYHVISFLGDHYISQHGKGQTAGVCIQTMELDLIDAGKIGPIGNDPTKRTADILYNMFINAFSVSTARNVAVAITAEYLHSYWL